MYQYRAAAQPIEGQHWSEFGLQLYVSALDEQHRADSASRSLARHLECTEHSIPNVQPPLTVHSSHAQPAQRLPGTRYPSRILPSGLQLSGSGHDYSLRLAATSAYRPAVTSEHQPARQLSASDPQWLSPCSRSFVSCHQHQADKQGLKRNCDLATSCLPAGKASQAQYACFCKVMSLLLHPDCGAQSVALQVYNAAFTQMIRIKQRWRSWSLTCRYSSMLASGQS